MKVDEHTYQLIEQYLREELPAEARTAFEQRLSTDASLAQALEFEKLSHEITTHANRARLRQQIAQDLARHDQLRRWKWIGGLALLLCCGWGLWLLTPRAMDDQTPPERVEKPNQNQPVEPVSLDSTPIADRVSITKNDNQTISNPESTPLKGIKAPTHKPTKEDMLLAHSDSLPVEEPLDIHEKETTDTVAHPITKANKLAETAPMDTHPCAKIRWQIHPVTEPSCDNDATGRIDLTGHIKGGQAPYLVEINGHQTNGQLAQLEAGSYSIAITDAAGCSQSVEAIVEQKTCQSNHFTFNPHLEESILLLENTGRYQLGVFSSSGRMVRQLTGNGDITWDGTGDQGNTLADGLYIYIIQTADSKLKGEVTLMH